MKGCYFVTGTDTEIGKSYAIAYLLQKYQAKGLSTLGLKPVAAGMENGVNEDAVILQKYSSLDLPIDTINPFCFKSPCSPHIAAREEGCELHALDIKNALSHPLSLFADLCLIEGAGGWYAPLSDDITWAEFVKVMKIPVIFVVGMKLGCLNHALLTEKALLSDGIEVKGWIANTLSPDMFKYQENLDTLKARLVSRFLCEVPYKALQDV